MAPRLSQEMRQNIVMWRTEQGYDITTVARLAHCSERTVWNVLQQYRDYGTPRNVLALPQTRPRILDTADLLYLAKRLQHSPAMYLDELADGLAEDRGVTVSVPTLSRALHRLALSRKQISREALERDELLRATWQAAYSHIPKESFLWLDESSIDNLTNRRSEGWSSLGRACVQRALFLRGQRYLILPALSIEGMVAMDILEGSVTKLKFINFIREQLVR